MGHNASFPPLLHARACNALSSLPQVRLACCLPAVLKGGTALRSAATVGGAPLLGCPKVEVVHAVQVQVLSVPARRVREQPWLTLKALASTMLNTAWRVH